jgi:anti-sigma factor RsiW
MCPDKQLLSVYYDDEIPSPWKEKMEAHIAFCPDCRDAVAAYGKLSSLLGLPVSQEASVSAACERMRERLSAIRSRAVPRAEPSFMRRMFTRRVAVPLPFAVAAAAVIVALAALVTQGRSARQIPNLNAVAGGINLEPEEISQVNSMDDALRYIENSEFFTGVESSHVIMRLPENKTFSNFGNPQLQNAANIPLKGAAGR